MARLRAQAASENPAELKSALNALKEFLRQNDSWQTPAATRLLARLQANSSNFDAAAQTCREAANRPGLSAMAKREQMREMILLEIFGKNIKQASAAIDALKPAASGGTSEALRLRGLEAVRDAVDGKPEKALTQLETLQTQAKDPADQSVIWLLRGYCESFAGRDDQALWAFLRVDQLHVGDQIAHAKAVEQLVKLFEGRSDWSKAAFFRCKLWRDFAG